MVLLMVLEPDDTQCNYFWYLGPIPDDYYNAFINVPVINYWLLGYHTWGMDSSWSVFWTAGVVYSFNLIIIIIIIIKHHLFSVGNAGPAAAITGIWNCPGPSRDHGIRILCRELTINCKKMENDWNGEMVFIFKYVLQFSA